MLYPHSFQVLNVGSQDGLVGGAAPVFVSRAGLIQVKEGNLFNQIKILYVKIDDDENVADTILIEIHADNEESFVDKNVTFTMFKIGESPGGE